MKLGPLHSAASVLLSRSVCVHSKKHVILQEFQKEKKKKRMRATVHTAGVRNVILSVTQLSSYSRQISHSKPTQTGIKAAILNLAAAASQMKSGCVRSRCLCSRSQWIRWSGTTQRTAESESRALTQAAKQTAGDRVMALGHRRYIRLCAAKCFHTCEPGKKEKKKRKMKI